MHRTPSPTAAFWLAAFTYFIWGFTFLASRIAQNYGTPFVLLFWRFALAFALMNLLCLTGRFHVRLRGRGLRPVDAALRDQDHVARLERIAPPLESVARRTAEEEDQLVEGMVMPVQLLLHRSFQVEQAEILAQIPALHIFRLRHGLPPSHRCL